MPAQRFISLLVTIGALTPAAVTAHDLVFPDRNDDAATRSREWTVASGWAVAPPEQPAGGGTRVAAILSVVPGERTRSVRLQARGLTADASGDCSASAAGPWTTMPETFTSGELRIAVLDLPRHSSCAQIRLAASDSAVVGDLQWELLEPKYPDAGRRSRELLGPATPHADIGPELEFLGVTTREEWGARATECSALEDEWYRMAIHHTAGPQTANGSVQERLQATQAYAMDSGTFCDIPYQMLVGYDGSLWEGRGLQLQSGATGGGNNDGNLAVCFIGCYHAPGSDCVGGEGHDPTDPMMLRGQLLVQTFVRMFGIPSDADSIRGHQDWPGNSTACPGSLLHPRLDELRADLAWFSGTEVDRSWDGLLEIPVGQAHELWIDLENTGGVAWQPGQTFLAPTDPRDVDSPLVADDWPSSIRAATVAAPVEPGDIGRFTFSVLPASADMIVQSFGLVHEGTTWFADAPWGGGPADDTVVVTVMGVLDPGADDTGDGTTSDDVPEPTTDTGPAGSTSTDDTSALPPAFGEDDSGGCACTSDGSRGSATWALVGLLPLLRRRRARPTTTRRRSSRGTPDG